MQRALVSVFFLTVDLEGETVSILDVNLLFSFELQCGELIYLKFMLFATKSVKLYSGPVASLDMPFHSALKC